MLAGAIRKGKGFVSSASSLLWRQLQQLPEADGPPLELPPCAATSSGRHLQGPPTELSDGTIRSPGNSDQAVTGGRRGVTAALAVLQAQGTAVNKAQ